jgi:hypothetical protein
VTCLDPLPREPHNFHKSFNAVYESGLPEGHLAVVESKTLQSIKGIMCACPKHTTHMSGEYIMKRFVPSGNATFICLHCVKAVSKELFEAFWKRNGGSAPFAISSSSVSDDVKRENLKDIKAQLNSDVAHYVGPYDSVVRTANGILRGQTCMVCDAEGISGSVIVNGGVHVCLECVLLFDQEGRATEATRLQMEVQQQDDEERGRVGEAAADAARMLKAEAARVLEKERALDHKIVVAVDKLKAAAQAVATVKSRYFIARGENVELDKSSLANYSKDLTTAKQVHSSARGELTKLQKLQSTTRHGGRSSSLSGKTH